MLLINSVRAEYSTDIFHQYCLYFGLEDILRVNKEDTLSNFEIEINDAGNFIRFELDGEAIIQRDFKHYFYRRGDFKLVDFDKLNVQSTRKLTRFLHKEMVCINEFLYLSLARTESRFGNKNEDAWDNKLNQLLVAVDCGLKIPSSIICNKKDSLRNFIAKYEKVIFKPLTYHYEELNEDHYIESSGTCLLKSSDFQKYESYFFPTLFQEYIEKKYEVRVFVWQENIFAMAIFSQNNKKTKIDFRNYDYKKPNRRVPYALPPDILERIKRLMTKLDLTTGSIDLICNQYDEYIFLEVNPSGQFGMISEPCNFYIERFIAKKLI